MRHNTPHKHAYTKGFLRKSMVRKIKAQEREGGENKEYGSQVITEPRQWPLMAGPFHNTLIV